MRARLVGFVGLLTPLAHAAAQAPSLIYQNPERYVYASAELPCCGFDDADSYANATFPFDASVNAAKSGEFGGGGIGLGAGYASQHSILQSFAIDATGGANASASSAHGDNDCPFVYAQGVSYCGVAFTLIDAVSVSATATVTAQAAGCCQGSAGAAVFIERLDVPSTLFAIDASAADGQEVTTKDAITLMLPPGDYRVTGSCSAHFAEVCGDDQSGAATFEFALDFGDRDRDGLLDVWETEGIDVNNDGTIDLDLPALGANPDRKDIFVEIDAMAGREPMPGALADVVAAFDNAPVPPVTPAQLGGITLHAMLDETGLPLAPWPGDFAQFDPFKDEHFGTPTERANPNWPNIKAARNLAFRYAVFADRYGTTSSGGLAEYPGNDLMVTLGLWPTPGGTRDEQAGIFMHELGHNLGLHHGGVDPVHYKPNYFSIMNYHWTTPSAGYAHHWRLDYSRERLADLNESMLLEPDGLGAFDPAYATIQVPFTANSTWGWANLADGEAADWTWDDDINPSPVAGDLNLMCPLCNGCGDCSISPGQTLRGHNDWSTLWYHLTGPQNFADAHEATTLDDEFSADDAALNDTIPPPPTTRTCAGDADGDNDVDSTDLNILLAAFAQPNPNPAADFDNDGDADSTDLNILLAAFAQPCP